VTPRDRLLAGLAPELVAAFELLVRELLDEALAEQSPRSPNWLSREEAAEYLGVSLRTLERSLARGRVHSTTIGRRRLLHRDDLDAFARAAAREDVAPTTPPRRRARTVDDLASSA
jgi:excisionase family DNA binding protein